MAQHPELVLHPIVGLERFGTCLALPPVGHFFRHLLVSRVRKAPHFYLSHGTFPLYEASNDFNQNYSRRIVDPLTRHLGGYRLDNPDLLAVLDRATPVGLNILRAVTTPDDMARYIATESWNLADLQVGTLWAEAAAGRFGSALDCTRERLAWFRRYPSPETEARMQLPDRQGLVRLEAALAQGPEAVLALLREIEARNVAMLKLERYWQPAPFPFEVTGVTS